MSRLFASAALVAGAALAAVPADKVTDLPTFGAPLSDTYSGYLDAGKGKHLREFPPRSPANTGRRRAVFRAPPSLPTAPHTCTRQLTLASARRRRRRRDPRTTGPCTRSHADYFFTASLNAPSTDPVVLWCE